VLSMAIEIKEPLYAETKDSGKKLDWGMCGNPSRRLIKVITGEV